jgi:hypothetical protein
MPDPMRFVQDERMLPLDEEPLMWNHLYNMRSALKALYSHMNAHAPLGSKVNSQWMTKPDTSYIGAVLPVLLPFNTLGDMNSSTTITLGC